LPQSIVLAHISEPYYPSHDVFAKANHKIVYFFRIMSEYQEGESIMQNGLNEVVIVGATRTPIGKYGGILTNLASYDMGSLVLQEIIKRVKFDSSLVDDVVMGCAYQSGHYLNTARQALLRAGFPFEVPGVTIDRQCISGLEAIAHGMRMIQTGDASVVLAGGSENMSNLPYYILNARWGYRLGNGILYDWFTDASETVSGPPERVGKLTMGYTAENVADQYGLSREDLDNFAIISQQKAAKAIDEGKFKEEIMPVEIPQRKGQTMVIDTDEHPRPDTTLERLAKLPPIFKEGGMVTAGNSCGMNDAAAVVALMSRQKAEELGLECWARVVSYAVAGVDPRYMGIGPVPATDAALKKAGLEMKDIDLIELNEAFAAQAIAVIREWENRGLRSQDIINVNGGAIALGHPIGATGGRLVVTLIHEMRRRDSRLGIASACVGGGMGGTLIIERL